MLFVWAGAVGAASITPVVLVCPGTVQSGAGNVQAKCSVPVSFVSVEALTVDDVVFSCGGAWRYIYTASTGGWSPDHYVAICNDNSSGTSLGKWVGSVAGSLSGLGVLGCASNHQVSVGSGSPVVYTAGCGRSAPVDEPVREFGWVFLDLAFLRPDLFGLSAGGGGESFGENVMGMTSNELLGVLFVGLLILIYIIGLIAGRQR